MRTRPVLRTATLLAALGGPLALAQTATNAPAVFDPGQLPTTQGRVAQYSLTPRGDVDGLILADGTEIHLPPHLGAQLVYAVKPGDSVTVHGLRARALPLVEASSIRNDASGATVADTGPAGPHAPAGPPTPLAATGTVKEQLHGPQGELNGVLLSDGTIVRLPPPEAQRLAPSLAIGAPLTVQGDGSDGPLGRVIAARQIGPDAQHLTQVAAPPPRPGRHPRLADQAGPAPSTPAPDAPPPPPRL